MLWMSVPSTDMPSGKPLAGMKLPSRCVRPNSTYSSSAGRSGRAVGLGVEEEVEAIDFGQRAYQQLLGGLPVGPDDGAADRPVRDHDPGDIGRLGVDGHCPGRVCGETTLTAVVTKIASRFRISEGELVSGARRPKGKGAIAVGHFVPIVGRKPDLEDKVNSNSSTGIAGQIGDDAPHPPAGPGERNGGNDDESRGNPLFQFKQGAIRSERRHGAAEAEPGKGTAAGRQGKVVRAAVEAPLEPSVVRSQYRPPTALRDLADAEGDVLHRNTAPRQDNTLEGRAELRGGSGQIEDQSCNVGIYHQAGETRGRELKPAVRTGPGEGAQATRDGERVRIALNPEIEPSLVVGPSRPEPPVPAADGSNLQTHLGSTVRPEDDTLDTLRGVPPIPLSGSGDLEPEGVAPRQRKGFASFFVCDRFQDVAERSQGVNDRDVAAPDDQIPAFMQGARPV